MVLFSNYSISLSCAIFTFLMVASEYHLDLNSQQFTVISQIITRHALQKYHKRIITPVYSDNLMWKPSIC